MTMLAVSIDITGLGFYDALSRNYVEALVNKNSKRADRLQRIIEQKIAKTINATLVQGKYGQTHVTDYVLSPSSPLLPYLKAESTGEGLPVEFKALAGAYKGTKIGQITLSTDRSYEIFGSSQGVSGVELAENILKTKKTGYLIDLDPYFTDQRNGTPKRRSVKEVTNRVFNFYFNKDPRLKTLLYAKASTMLLNNVYSLNNNGKQLSGTRLIGLRVPLEDFNGNNFKAKIEDNAIVISINDTFQRKLFDLINDSYLQEVTEAAGPKLETVVINKKTTKIYVMPALQGTQAFGTVLTNSIKVFPADTTRITTTINKESKTKQQFISNIQWTMLTQKRLGETMKRIGAPEPPNIKERSGRFRRSVEVSANYRARIISYTYNPLYRGLEHYGYHPEIQVERAIREVAQQLYSKHFSINRKGSLA